MLATVSLWVYLGQDRPWHRSREHGEQEATSEIITTHIKIKNINSNIEVVVITLLAKPTALIYLL